MAKRSFYILAYDMADDKRRSRISKEMEAIGARVQGSVFEAYLTDKDLETLQKRILKILEDSEDSVRVYPICAICKEKIITMGTGKITKPPGLVVI